MTAPVTKDATETMVGSSNDVGLWVGPVGTNPPADLSAAFATPWAPLGYASQDGVTIGGDTTVESFTPWQGMTPIRQVVTARSRTVHFILWQLNQDTLGLYFDQDLSGVTATGGAFDFDLESDAPQQLYAIGVDALDGSNALRVVYPRASLTTTGDLTLARGAMVPLEVTLGALDDGGVLAHVWVGGGGSLARTRGGKQSKQAAARLGA